MHGSVPYMVYRMLYIDVNVYMGSVEIFSFSSALSVEPLFPAARRMPFVGRLRCTGC